MKYRSGADICAELLQAAKGGGNKNKLMYSARTSFRVLNSYIELLIVNGMLKHVEEERFYYTTKKGIRFLQSYDEALCILTPKGE